MPLREDSRICVSDVLVPLSRVLAYIGTKWLIIEASLIVFSLYRVLVHYVVGLGIVVQE